MSTIPERYLRRVQLGLTVMMTSSVITTVLGMIGQAQTNYPYYIPSNVLSTAILVMAFAAARRWWQAIKHNDLAALPLRTAELTRRWVLVMWLPLITFAAIYAAFLAWQVFTPDLKPILLIPLVLFSVISFGMYQTGVGAVLRWFQSFARSLTGEASGVAVNTRQSALNWLTAMQVIQVAAVLNLYTAFDGRPAFSVLPIVMSAFDGAVQLLGTTWLKSTVATVPALPGPLLPVIATTAPSEL